MASRPCKFWLQGQCKYGDNCKFEHPRNAGNRNDNNRFAPLNDSRNYGNSNSRSQSNDPRDRSRYQSNQERYVDQEQLRKDLSTERPIWSLSCYSARSDMPKNLFGGLERELSPEEMRFRCYELAGQGKLQDAIREAETLQRNAANQMDNVLRDMSGAIKYLQNGFNEHPNRIDICNECTKTGIFVTTDTNQQKSSSNATGAFGQLSGSSALVAPKQPSGTLPFGQPISPAANSAFGLPSKLAPSPAFGQSGFLQAPAQSSFGRPSGSGAAQTAFGQPSGLGPRSSPFGQANQPTATPFGQPSNPFSQQAQQQQQQQLTDPGPFTTQLANQVSMQMSPTSNQNPFGTSSSSFATSSSFQQANSGFPSSSATGFGQSNSDTGAFGQASGGRSGTNSGIQGFSAPIQSSMNGTNTSAVRGMQGKLQSWKGKRVQYFDNEPCYQEDDGFWQRIWFSDGPPAWNKPETLPTDLPYDTETEERFKHASDSKQFGYGDIPLIPPRREWTDWDF